MKHPLPALFAALALMLLALPARADIRSEHAQDIKRIEEYLSSLTTIVSEFSQVAPDGTLTGGKFYLKRPGKMRWQYDPPTPILMVADGFEIIYFDYELEQISRIPLDSTLAAFLAQDKIDLSDKTVNISDFQKTPGMLRLTLSQTDKPEAGTLTLEFSDSPILIRTMVVTDAQGQVTTVALNNAQFGAELENKLFVFEDTRKNRRRN